MDKMNDPPSVAPPQASCISPPRKPDDRTTIGHFKGVPEAAPFSDYEDYLARGQRFGNVNLVGYYHPNRGSSIWIDEATPDYNRPSAEVFLDAISRLPDSTLLCHLEIVNHEHLLGPWIKQTTGGIVAGETTNYATVILYRPTVENLELTLAHHWGRLLLNWYPTVVGHFERAMEVEPLPFPGQSVNSNNDPQTQWSILAEMFLTLPTPRSFELALMIPVKAGVFGKVLKHHLDSLPRDYKSPKHAQYVDLAVLLDHIGEQFGVAHLKQNLSPNSDKLLAWLAAPEGALDDSLIPWDDNSSSTPTAPS